MYINISLINSVNLTLTFLLDPVTKENHNCIINLAQSGTSKE